MLQTLSCQAETWYAGLTAARPLVVILSGPSGVGKDATVQRIRQVGYPCHFVVTATSRQPRPGEVHGVDYYFYSEEQFKALIEQGELLEHAVVYHQYKGIPKAGMRNALASGNDVLMRIDVQGAATVSALIPQAVTIFLTAESEEALIARLRQRGGDSEAQIEQRILTARAELARAQEFRYRVVNRVCALDETVEKVLAIIQAEKCRLDWQPVVL